MAVEKFKRAYVNQIVEIINESFNARLNFNAATPTWFVLNVLQKTTAIERFDADDFLVFKEREQVEGFIHFGRYREDYVSVMWPGQLPVTTGVIFFFAVRPSSRRKGVGKALFEAAMKPLSRCKRIILDWQCMNPFYGNSEAPRRVLFGQPEGPGIPAGDTETVKFLEKMGFKAGGSFPQMRVSLDGVGKFEKGELKLGKSFMPLIDESIEEGIIGDADFESLYTGKNAKVTGHITYLPVTEKRDVWGIYRFELSKGERGKGVGRLLLDAAMKRIASLGGKRFDTVTIPAVSPSAYNLYKSLGFKEIEHWLSFEDYTSPVC